MLISTGACWLCSPQPCCQYHPRSYSDEVVAQGDWTAGAMPLIEYIQAA